VGLISAPAEETPGDNSAPITSPEENPNAEQCDAATADDSEESLCEGVEQLHSALQRVAVMFRALDEHYTQRLEHLQLHM